MKLKRNLLLLVAALVALGAGLAAGVVARSGGFLGDRPDGTFAPAGQPWKPTPLAAIDPAAAADEAKPRYRGALGDFVVADHAADYPCPPPYKPADPKASELYSPVFSEGAEASQCGDGRIVGISAAYDRGASIGRRYFVGPAKVPYEAPLDRLKLLTVAGRPAIAQLPMPGIRGSLRLAVIERLPSGDQAGILVWIDNTDMSLEEAVELAEQIMGVQP